MEITSDARPIIPSSLIAGGRPLSSWTWDRAYSAVKTCAVCGREHRPKLFTDRLGITRPEGESGFNKRVCCSRSCAKKLKNPMHCEDSREKMSRSLKEVGHRPKVRGGNGREMPAIQARALEMLGPEWVAEYVVKTGLKPKDGYPHCYKIDAANPVLMVALELDGNSHCSLLRKAQDEKKDELLRRYGWRVLRLKNRDAELMFTTFGSAAIHRILQMAS